MEPSNKLPPDLLTAWRTLRQRAVETAWFHPRVPDYIVIEWIHVKDKIDKNMEAEAAKILYHMLAYTNPTYILGIAESGLSFARAVHTLFPHAKFVVADKTSNGKGLGSPYRQTSDVDRQENRMSKPIIDTSGDTDQRFTLVKARSYSAQKEVIFRVPKIQPDARVLVIDDVCDTGEVAVAICETIQRQGATLVGFGVYFDKMYKSGLAKVAQIFKIPCFSVIRIKDAVDQKITLLDEEKTLKLL